MTYTWLDTNKDWANKSDYKKKIYSAPTCINLEITEGCNFKCLHCYNPWREVSAGKNHLTNDQFDYLLEEFISNGVFHVILSGGEPLVNYKLLLYAIPKLLENNISISLNSNVSLITKDKAKQLRDIGLDHILASWYSTDPNTTSHITQVKGAQDKVIEGIKTCIEAGIRMSVNTIVTSHTINSVYEAGKFLAELGVQQFIAHRVIPPAYERSLKEKNPANNLQADEAKETLDILLRLKEEYSINVSTLIGYPLCMIGDLDKYSDFVGRGCPSQSGHRFNINASGDSHTCVMEDASYGDVFKNGLKATYAKTQFWRDNSVFFEGCKSCEYINVCQTGCRMSALATTGNIDGKDPLMLGSEHITNHIKAIADESHREIMNKPEARIYINPSLRFRQEDGFGLINIRWGNTIEVETNLFDSIKNAHENSSYLTVKKLLTTCNNKNYLASLISKEVLAINSEDFSKRRSHRGVSTDPAKLPAESFL